MRQHNIGEMSDNKTMDKIRELFIEKSQGDIFEVKCNDCGLSITNSTGISSASPKQEALVRHRMDSHTDETGHTDFTRTSVDTITGLTVVNASIVSNIDSDETHISAEVEIE